MTREQALAVLKARATAVAASAATEIANREFAAGRVERHLSRRQLALLLVEAFGAGAAWGYQEGARFTRAAVEAAREPEPGEVAQ